MQQLEQFKGLAGNPDIPTTTTYQLEGVIRSVLGVAGEVTKLVSVGNVPPRFLINIGQAVESLALAANALMAAADIKCTLAKPPSDVRIRPRGPAGELITECIRHDPQHCWTGSGQQISCP